MAKCPNCNVDYINTKKISSYSMDTSSLWDKDSKLEKEKGLCPNCGFTIDEKEKDEQDKKI